MYSSQFLNVNDSWNVSAENQDMLLEQAKSFLPYLSSSANSPFLVPTTEPAGYARRAAFATTSRLLSCLVNEAIVAAYYYVSYGASAASSSYILFVPSEASSDTRATKFILSQVRHKPVVDAVAVDHTSGGRIRLLDPEDLGVCQWIKKADSSALIPVESPSQVMIEIGLWNNYESEKVHSICKELESSVENQLFAYKSRGPDPDILMSTATEWEQSIVEGHATHPMYRARYAVPPLKPIVPQTNFVHLKLGFVAVPRSKLRVEGHLEELLHPLYSSADFDASLLSDASASVNVDSDASRYILDFVDRSEEFVLPVHPLHMPAVLDMFSFARQLPFFMPAEAQASLRTVCPKAFAPLGYDIKLPLGIKVSSALRTISPWSTFVGPRVTMVIPDILSKAPVADALLIAGEPASAVSNDPDFDIAKYLSCVIRNDPEHICRLRNERVILAAALTGYNDDGVSVVVRQWKLDSVEKRIGFLEEYVDKLFDAFLPPIMNHGFAFEAHPQNSLLRIDAETGVVKGFIVRDFGGVKVHREAFTSSTGAVIDMLPDSCTDAKSLYEVYDLAYHTLVQCQLHRLIRALDLHYCGNGWSIVRRSFEKRVPNDHPLYTAWYQECFDLKCFVTMKLDGLYRDYVYRKVPNLLFYIGEDKGVVYPIS
ncbi:hypothetical protein J3B02_001584 [Coemansia erecta]|uniref:Aerobactin siderophore biosynthesis IucA/IucC N-terminal domain-containing protein n=1 Tax=Coemansia asiatica TaxID=1052880 RepID=A0A9W7XM69_9FUNG|nr:hypothetical protein LPJ64_002394 [Coemansia asiatica]KAJ2856470.1 hypothetical protein J3B02_001584 [Coemansia erecta]KAJ2881566.1 hypothetical protein FB639_002586 [Coemansia asiatica]